MIINVNEIEEVYISACNKIPRLICAQNIEQKMNGYDDLVVEKGKLLG